MSCTVPKRLKEYVFLSHILTKLKRIYLFIRLRDGFFNPDMLYQSEMIDEMMRGLVSTPMENQDQFISGDFIG